MPTLHHLSHSKATIKMFADDHPPPHIHVIGPEWAGLVSMKNLEVFQGSIPADVLADVREWMVKKRDFLNGKWRELNERDD